MKRHAEVRQEHHRDRQDVQEILGRGTRRDEGACQGAEGAASKADDEKAVLAKIAEMPEPDRLMAERLHAIVKASAPALLAEDLVRDARVCQGRQDRLLLHERG